VTDSTTFDAEGGAAQVSVLPRSFWDEDPRFLETFPEDMRENIRVHFDRANFSPDAHYAVLLYMKDTVPRQSSVYFLKDLQGILRADEIADELTSAATTPEDLAAAIAYFKDRCLTQDQFRPITDYFERQAAARGPSRALHNQVARAMMHSWSLEFRLVGLRGATHLNGRAGAIRDFYSTDTNRFVSTGQHTNRFIVRLDDDDGKEVSAKAENVEYVRGDNYRRRAP
jgi:hypothetical protein